MERWGSASSRQRMEGAAPSAGQRMGASSTWTPPSREHEHERPVWSQCSSLLLPSVRMLAIPFSDLKVSSGAAYLRCCNRAGSTPDATAASEHAESQGEWWIFDYCLTPLQRRLGQTEFFVNNVYVCGLHSTPAVRSLRFTFIHFLMIRACRQLGKRMPRSPEHLHILRIMLKRKYWEALQLKACLMIYQAVFPLCSCKKRGPWFFYMMRINNKTGQNLSMSEI